MDYKKILVNYRRSITNYKNIYEKEAKQALKKGKGYFTPLELEDRHREHLSAHSAAKALEMAIAILNDFIKKQ